METQRTWGPEDEPEDEDTVEDLDPTIDRRLALEFDPLS